MLEAERHQHLLDLLQERGRVTIHEIMRAVATSEATLRRDLAKLDREGRLRRIRGGAEALVGALTQMHPYAKAANLDRKRRIAARAAALCGTGDAMLIDGGSTTYHMAPHLGGEDKTVFTNSLPIAQYLLRHSGHRLILPAGEIERRTLVIQNPFDTNRFGHYAWRWAFMGCEGLDDHGVTNSDSLLIRDEQRMIDAAERVAILADSSKFRSRGQLRLCEWNRIDYLISDELMAPEVRERLAGQGVEVLTA